MNFNVISFYRYTPIKNPEQLMDLLRSECQKRNILGRVLLGTEGINGAVCGTKDKIEDFKKILQSHFKGLTFREQEYAQNTYHKLVIKVRKEICAFGEDVDLQNIGVHLKPQELNQLYQDNEDFVIIDARNDYEFDVGHFKNAKKLPIQSFREFAKATEDLVEYKNKKVVLYCTGGVRCEKASAYMKEQGFQEVYQLDGGIINYVNTVEAENKDNFWKGGLFVFDDRLVSEMSDPITKCTHCDKQSEHYYNCHNLDCDVLFLSCSSCKEKWATTCSDKCRAAPRQRPKVKKQVTRKKVGIVENYYPKSRVALIKVQEQIKQGDKVLIKGKTTTVDVTVSDFKSHEGSLITIPLQEKVRKNDAVYLAC